MKTIGLTLFYDSELLIVLFRILLVSALIWVFFRFAPVRWKREKLPPKTNTFIRVSRRKPMWTKRDWFYVCMITAAYAVVSLHRLGSTVFPVTTWQPSATPQSIILHFPEATHFDAVYASPLKRAYETAEIAISKSETRDNGIIKDDRLREIGFGVIEGLRYSGEDGAELDKANWAFFVKPEAYEAPTGGETFEDLAARAQSFLDDLLQTQRPDARVIIFGHGAVIKGIIRQIKDLPLAELWDGAILKNCETVSLMINGKGKELK